jgi:hypothetical protein
MDKSGTTAPGLARASPERLGWVIPAAWRDVVASSQGLGRAAPSELAETCGGRAERRLVGAPARATVRRRRANAQVAVACRVAIVGGVLTTLLCLV